MGALRSAGYCVVYHPSGEVRSLHKTWRGAQRAHRLAHDAGHVCLIFECWHSSATKEST